MLAWSFVVGENIGAEQSAPDHCALEHMSLCVCDAGRRPGLCASLFVAEPGGSS